MKIILIFLMAIFQVSVYGNTLQETTLRSSLVKKDQKIDFNDFYTYLETAPFIFEGQNAFEALTFRGRGIKVFLSYEDSSIRASVEGKDILLGRLDRPVDTLQNGFNSINIHSSVQVSLDHASLGKSYNVRVPVCLPGLPCFSKAIRITPHRYKYTIIGVEGDAFCVQRGFDRKASNDLEIDDTYSLGKCR